ncbi:MAG: hypothetical protein R3F11_00340 [Verrucomicrobiales bacterium]
MAAVRRPLTIEAGVTCGLRINPEHSTGKVPLYDPCAPGSRLGTRAADMASYAPPGTFDALTETCPHAVRAGRRRAGRDRRRHGGALCPLAARVAVAQPRRRYPHHPRGPTSTACSASSAACRTATACEDLPSDRRGGGHHTGFLVAVIDIVENAVDRDARCVIGDGAYADVLEMPYRPEIIGAGEPGEEAHLSARRTDLPGKRLRRHVFVRRAAAPRGPARLHRHGALHDGEDDDVQRREASGGRQLGIRRPARRGCCGASPTRTSARLG